MTWVAIKLYFGNALGFLSKLPREVWYALAAVVAWWVFSNHYEQQGYDKRTAEYAEIARKAALRAKKADDAAIGAVDAERGAVEASNQAARDAAEGSDDPLRDGLRALD